MRTLRNIGWNLVGLLIPVAAAACVTPALIRHLGVERFGILTLAWMLAGYFTLFDFGVGRALTKLVAEVVADRDRGQRTQAELDRLIGTGLLAALALGVVGGAIVAAVASPLANHVLKLPRGLVPETTASFQVLALSIPLVVASSALRGLLEAKMLFRLTSSIRAIQGCWFFVGPLAILWVSSSLVAVTAMLVLGRALGAGAYFLASRKAFPSAFHRLQLGKAEFRRLLSFGGWMTVTNIVSPVMSSMDRFFIGATLSVAFVAYYTTPFEMITKLSVISGAVVGVLFPEFSSLFTVDRARCDEIFRRASLVLLGLVGPIAALIAFFARDLMSLWLGADFASHSYITLQILAVAVAINATALVPFSLIQAAGRPDLTAKFHLLELPLYLGTVVFFTHQWGIAGTAAAWLLRVTVDLVLLHAAAVASVDRSAILRDQSPALLMLLVLALARLELPLLLRGILAAAISVAAGVLIWRRGLDDRMRRSVLSLARAG